MLGFFFGMEWIRKFFLHSCDLVTWSKHQCKPTLLLLGMRVKLGNQLNPKDSQTKIPVPSSKKNSHHLQTREERKKLFYSSRFLSKMKTE